MTLQEKQNAWLLCPVMPEELLSQLRSMDADTLNDCFYRDLAFGTGGLRGVLGAGTNRMNLFTVMKATFHYKNIITHQTALLYKDYTSVSARCQDYTQSV